MKHRVDLHFIGPDGMRHNGSTLSSQLKAEAQIGCKNANSPNKNLIHLMPCVQYHAGLITYPKIYIHLCINKNPSQYKHKNRPNNFTLNCKKLTDLNLH